MMIKRPCWASARRRGRKGTHHFRTARSEPSAAHHGANRRHGAASDGAAESRSESERHVVVYCAVTVSGASISCSYRREDARRGMMIELAVIGSDGLNQRGV